MSCLLWKSVTVLSLVWAVGGEFSSFGIIKKVATFTSFITKPQRHFALIHLAEHLIFSHAYCHTLVSFKLDYCEVALSFHKLNNIKETYSCTACLLF